MSLQRFTASFSAPGFYETETVFAENQASAALRAAEIAAEPRAGWPYCNPSAIKITVVPAALPALARAAE